MEHSCAASYVLFPGYPIDKKRLFQILGGCFKNGSPPFANRSHRRHGFYSGGAVACGLARHNVGIDAYFRRTDQSHVTSPSPCVTPPPPTDHRCWRGAFAASLDAPPSLRHTLSLSTANARTSTATGMATAHAHSVMACCRPPCETVLFACHPKNVHQPWPLALSSGWRVREAAELSLREV